MRRANQSLLFLQNLYQNAIQEIALGWDHSRGSLMLWRQETFYETWMITEETFWCAISAQKTKTMAITDTLLFFQYFEIFLPQTQNLNKYYLIYCFIHWNRNEWLRCERLSEKLAPLKLVGLDHVNILFLNSVSRATGILKRRYTSHTQAR